MSDAVSYRHWFLEIRRRLLRSSGVTLLTAVLLLPLAKTLFVCFAQPLWQQLPANSQVIAIQLLSGFWLPFEVSLLLALWLTIPWWLLELWWLCKPALYRRERYALARSLLLAWFLFSLGMCFAYAWLLPMTVHFLTAMVPAPVVMMPDIALYTGFALRLLLSFGVLFELPLLIIASVRFQWLSLQRIKAWRRYMVVWAFVVGMIIAPDPLSQCLIALPMYGLYEIGVYFAKNHQKNPA